MYLVYEVYEVSMVYQWYTSGMNAHSYVSIFVNQIQCKFNAHYCLQALS